MPPLRLPAHLCDPADVAWRWFCPGQGNIIVNHTLCLQTPPTAANIYTDAQIDDYQGLARHQFRWSPPLRLIIRARFSHSAGTLIGTAGFGFWNDPFLMTGLRWPTLPRALWFFYASSPSNMKLDSQTPGKGWKAAVIDVPWRRALPLAPLAPLAALLWRQPRWYQRTWSLVQQWFKISETALPAPMTEWHTYRIDWSLKTVDFWVDDHLVLQNAPAPRGPLGLVIWLDNQFMVVLPQGKLKHGLLAQTETQWLEIERISLT